jgi:uroporphyrin-III C-methyltransferase
MASIGTVHLVGAGPGAPDLLTLRAARLLARADIVFYDALVHPEVIALAQGAEHVAVGKRCGRHSTAQRFITKRLVDAARKHAVVVRLKGGDPMLFGRAHEELEGLREAGIPFEIVPGVTSALGAAADAGISLTQRGVSRSVSFLTPRVGDGEQASEWTRVALAADTAVIYMGAGQAGAISAALIAGGARSDLPVLVVENATLPESRRIPLTLAALPLIADAGISGPALIMLGEVFAAAAEAAMQPVMHTSCMSA